MTPRNDIPQPETLREQLLAEYGAPPPTGADRALLEALLAACASLAAMANELADAGPVTVGSRGQPVPHPLLRIQAGALLAFGDLLDRWSGACDVRRFTT